MHAVAVDGTRNARRRDISARKERGSGHHRRTCLASTGFLVERRRIERKRGEKERKERERDREIRGENMVIRVRSLYQATAQDTGWEPEREESGVGGGGGVVKKKPLPSLSAAHSLTHSHESSTTGYQVHRSVHLSLTMPTEQAIREQANLIGTG